MDGLLDGLPAEDVARLRLADCVRTATSIRPLEGGITNRNYKVTTPDGTYVVRLSDPESSLLSVDRDNEYLNSLGAARSGAGARVDQYLPGRGVLVIGWVEGVTLSAEALRDPAMLARIGAACRELHAGPAFANDFDMFAIQRRYREIVEERGFRLPPRYDEFADHAASIRSAFAAAAEPRVPCNNDLLPANIIDAGTRLWLIDYEYSGNNEASFEIGNIWSEATLADDLLEVLVASYWGEPTRARIARARLWALMSKYGWTLWASISEAISPIDFDYWSWGMEKYERALAEFDSPTFEGWLEDVAGE